MVLNSNVLRVQATDGDEYSNGKIRFIIVLNILIFCQSIINIIVKNWSDYREIEFLS